MTELESQIGDFYETMMEEYFYKDMLKFVNVTMHKDAFIRGAMKVISEVLHGNIDMTDIDEFPEAVRDNVKFFFNHFDGECVSIAEEEIEDFIRQLC